MVKRKPLVSYIHKMRDVVILKEHIIQSLIFRNIRLGHQPCKTYTEDVYVSHSIHLHFPLEE
jgi:hypothetical protein